MHGSGAVRLWLSQRQPGESTHRFPASSESKARRHAFAFPSSVRRSRDVLLAIALQQVAFLAASSSDALFSSTDRSLASDVAM
jgi:hypothetical protein